MCDVAVAVAVAVAAAVADQTIEFDANLKETGNDVFLSCQPPDGCQENNQCTAGYYKERCSECLTGYYRHFVSGKCEQCPEGAALLLIIYFLAFALVGFFGYQVCVTVCGFVRVLICFMSGPCFSVLFLYMYYLFRLCMVCLCMSLRFVLLSVFYSAFYSIQFHAILFFSILALPQRA